MKSGCFFKIFSTLAIVPLIFGQDLSCIASEQTDESLMRNVEFSFQHHHYKQAVKICSVIISHNDKNGEAYFYRGISNIFMDEPEAGLADLDRAGKIDPSLITPVALDARYRAYIGVGKFKEAIADLSSNIARYPKVFFRYKERGQLYGLMKNYNAGIADMTTAIKLAPEQSINYLNRGNLYSTTGDYTKAVADYSMVIKLKPNDPVAYGARARVYEKMGLKDKAKLDNIKANELGGWQM